MVTLTDDEHDYYLELEKYALHLLSTGLGEVNSSQMLSALVIKKDIENAKLSVKELNKLRKTYLNTK